VKPAVGLLILVLSACSSGTAGQTTSPTPASSASSSPSPKSTVAPAVAVVDWDQGFAGYTLRLVSADAKILATVHALWPYGGKCGPVEAGIITPPPVSTSNSRAYYLDAGGIKWLKEDGTTGVAFGALQSRPNIAIAFAVEPDDSAFAMNTIDYSATPLTQHLTVTPVGATALGTEIYSARSSASNASAAVWPVGWRGGNIVLAYHRGTCTQGGGPGLADATSYHVVNATTAGRITTIGLDAGGQCGVMGPPTPTGIACASYDGTNTRIFLWDGTAGVTFSGSFPGGLSPTGTFWVGTVMQTSQSSLSLSRAAGSGEPIPGSIGAVMWIDDGHFLVIPYGAPGTSQPSVYSINPLHGTPVSAPGTPVARIPASLEI
jgi:hypothetical protein